MQLKSPLLSMMSFSEAMRQNKVTWFTGGSLEGSQSTGCWFLLIFLLSLHQINQDSHIMVEAIIQLNRLAISSHCHVLI